jgi:hypothetical protein
LLDDNDDEQEPSQREASGRKRKGKMKMKSKIQIIQENEDHHTSYSDNSNSDPMESRPPRKEGRRYRHLVQLVAKRRRIKKLKRRRKDGEYSKDKELKESATVIVPILV